MPKPIYEVSLENGKYTFQTFAYDDRVHILRSGEPWIQMSQGSKAMIALLDEFEQMKFRLESLEK
jgi:hypothetical protein